KGVADLATWTSADGGIVVESLAVSSPGVGSVVPAGGVTLAGLASVAVGAGATVPLAVNGADAPARRAARGPKSPLPPAAAQIPPSVAVHVHVTPVSAAGNESTTEAPVTALGPALATVIV